MVGTDTLLGTPSSWHAAHRRRPPRVPAGLGRARVQRTDRPRLGPVARPARLAKVDLGQHVGGVRHAHPFECADVPEAGNVEVAGLLGRLRAARATVTNPELVEEYELRRAHLARRAASSTNSRHSRRSEGTARCESHLRPASLIPSPLTLMMPVAVSSSALMRPRRR